MSVLNQLKNQAKALQTQRTEQDLLSEEKLAVTEKACQRGSVVATADHEHGFVQFCLLNTTGFEVAKAPYPAARIDHETLDELAKRIVAQESRFG